MQCEKMTGLGPVKQLAFVPSDFDGTLKYWIQTTGAGPFYLLPHLPADGLQYRSEVVRPDLSVAIGHWGDLQIEIIQQHNDAPSPFHDWRQSGTEGLHHVCVAVDDIAAARDVCRQTGGEIDFGGHMSGTEWSYVDTGAARVRSSKSSSMGPGMGEFMTMVRDAARNWDGNEPIRIAQR